MIGYVANIKELTKENNDFRRVLYSGSKLQLVLMSIAPSEQLGGETHADTDQFFRIKTGDGIVVPAGTHHNVICTGHDTLKL